MIGTELIWLAGFPRSGVTLLRHVIEAMTGIKTFSVHRDECQGRLLNIDNSLLCVEHFTDEGGPIFSKTNNLWHADTQTKAIYVVRDGRDAIVSLAHYKIDWEGLQAEYPRLLKTLIETKGWAAHVRRWTQRKAPTAVVHFEDLKTKPHRTVREAFKKLELGGIGLQDFPIPSFEALRDKNPGVFREGKSGYVIPEKLEKDFLQLYGDTIDYVKSLRSSNKP